MCNYFCRCARLSAYLSVFGIAVCSCVNEEYDLKKEIDGTAVIMKDVSMPIGNLEKITVDKILAFDSEDQMIVKAENGDLAFRFTGSDPIEADLTVPLFQIPLEDGSKGDDHYITINTGTLAGKNGADHDELIHLENQRVEKVIKVSDADLLPYQIIDVREVETATVIDYNFSVSEGSVHIGEGFQMDFPDWLVVEKYDNDANYVVETVSGNRNVVLFTKDVKVSEGTPYVIDLIIKKITVPEGSIVDGGNDSEGRPCKKLMFDEEDEANMVIVTGDIYADPKDFSVIPAKIDLKMHLEFSDYAVKKAEVSLDMRMNLDDQEVAITEYPDFFKKEGVVMDLYNAYLNFHIDNQIPLDLDLNADFIAYKASAPVVDIKLGTEADAYLFRVPAAWTGTLSFSRLGNEEGVTAVPEIGNILTSLPDKVAVSNISAVSSHDYITIEPGQTFLCSVGYELYAPLAFGNDFRLIYDMDINDLGLDLREAGVTSAKINFNVQNSVPLDFKIAAAALDAEGNPAEGMTLKVNGSAAPGTLAAPTSSPVSITLTSSTEGITLDALRLSLTATCPSSQYQGVALNSAQGLQISGLSLNLPEGITLDVNNIFNADPAPEEGEE